MQINENPPLCKCGCGKEIIPQYHHKYYNTPHFIRGHNSRVQHPMYGKKHSDTTIQIMRVAKKGKKFNNTHKGAISKGNKGKKRTDVPTSKRKRSIINWYINYINWT